MYSSALGTEGSASWRRRRHSQRLRQYDQANLSGGAGNDRIDANHNAVVDAGTGDDTVTTYSHATVSAGDGDDYVLTNDYSVVDGGAGNDTIQVGGASTVAGSAGKRCRSGRQPQRERRLSISGYSQNDVIVTRQYGKIIVNFKGSNDSLAFNLGSHGSARLSFADHTSVDIHA